jgi:UDP-glucose 4-epimerase
MTGLFGGKRILVTGGAGFIGSHLTDRLLEEGAAVTVFDDMSSGSETNVSGHRNNPKFSFERASLLEKDKLKTSLAEIDAVYHLAASPDTRTGLTDTRRDLEQNVLATHALLESMRGSKTRSLVFASTSTVYGEAAQMPTPESYGPAKPISLYGASKLSSEGFISAYCHMFGFSASVLRLANVVGPRITHGAIFDFYTNLRRNSKRLEIQGDGTQRKSYLHVDDCVAAFLAATPSTASGMEVYNAGSEDQTDVMSIAKIVAEEMSLPSVQFELKTSTSDGRGWKGDVKEMLLDVSKLKSKGWLTRFTSEEAVRATAQALVQSGE